MMARPGSVNVYSLDIGRYVYTLRVYIGKIVLTTVLVLKFTQNVNDRSTFNTLDLYKVEIFISS